MDARSEQQSLVECPLPQEPAITQDDTDSDSFTIQGRSKTRPTTEPIAGDVITP